MEKNPYKFSEANPRLVEGAVRDNKVYAAAASIWLVSMYAYNRKFLRKDGNFIAAMAFGALSGPAAYGFGDTMMGDPVTEAGMRNNERERTL